MCANLGFTPSLYLPAHLPKIGLIFTSLSRNIDMTNKSDAAYESTNDTLNAKEPKPLSGPYIPTPQGFWDSASEAIKQKNFKSTGPAVPTEPGFWEKACKKGHV
jgi:hypothetical protein